MYVIRVLSLEGECLPLSQIYLLSYRALLVLRVCVGCHERCPSTYLRSLFCPTLSLVLDACVRVLCSTVSRCLLSILAHSCRSPSTQLRSLFCPSLSLVLDTCVRVLCSTVSRCLLSILARSCRRRHSASCFCSSVIQL